MRCLYSLPYIKLEYARWIPVYFDTLYGYSVPYVENQIMAMEFEGKWENY